MKAETVFPNYEDSSPATCVAAKVMKCNRIVANTFRKHLKVFDITSSQLGILFIVAKKGGLNQKAISQILFMEKSTINRNLKRLVTKKYISKKDFSTIVMTDSGMEFLERVVPHWENAMKDIRGVLGDDGERSLDFLTMKLTNQN